MVVLAVLVVVPQSNCRPVLQASSLETHQTENIFVVDAHKSNTSMSTFSLKAAYTFGQDTAV